MTNPLRELNTVLENERADIERFDRASRRLEHTRHVRRKVEERVVEELEREVRARVAAELMPHLPAGCEVDVFISENGDADWVIPLAVQVDHPTDRAVDGYGLCDAAAADYGQQADYLVEQLREGLGRYLPTD